MLVKNLIFMKRLQFFLLFFCIFLLSCAKIVVVEDISGLRMEKTNNSDDKDKHLIIDVRTNRAYRNGHLEFALNIPHEELAKRIVEIKDLKHLPVYIYGVSANDSFASAQILVENGFENIFNAEAVDEHIYPLVRFNTIRVYDVRNSVNSENFFLIDYRTSSSFQVEHFKGAVNIPIGEIPNNLEHLPKDKNRPIVIYCNTGVGSAWGAKELVDLGYTNVSAVLEGAISDSFVKEMDKENVKED